MSNLFIKRAGRDPFEIPKNQVVASVKNGELLADDEVSLDGQFWIRLDQYKQLGALFKPGASEAPAASQPKPMTESEFYSSARVPCPKCGHEQDRGDACVNCNLLFEKYWKLLKAKTEKKSEQAIEPELDSEKPEGFLKKLWNGKYPLWKTFWLFGVAYPLCILVPIQLIFAGKMQGIVEGTMNRKPASNEESANMMMAMMAEMKTYFMIFAIVMLAHLVYAFILNIGFWRSANNYTGNKIWRLLARMVVALYFILLPFSIYGIYKYSTGFEEEMKRFEYQFEQNQQRKMSIPGKAARG